MSRNLHGNTLKTLLEEPGSIPCSCLKGKVHAWLLSKTSRLTWCIPSCAYNNKHVKMLAQSVFEVARKWWKKNTPVGRICVLSYRNKILLLEVFYYFSEKLPLSQKLQYFRGSRFPQCFILSTAFQCLLPSQFLS